MVGAPVIGPLDDDGPGSSGDLFGAEVGRADGVAVGVGVGAATVGVGAANVGVGSATVGVGLVVVRVVDGGAGVAPGVSLGCGVGEDGMAVGAPALTITSTRAPRATVWSATGLCWTIRPAGTSELGFKDWVPSLSPTLRAI